MKRIYFNASVLTADDNMPQAQAICVEDGKFVAVGSNDEVMVHKTADTELVDMQGKSILPGFYDSHMHVLSHGMIIAHVNMNDCDSIEGLIEHIKKFIADKKIPEGTWIRGRGWNNDKFKDEARFINRYDLDKISTKHPFSLVRTCGHVVVTNSLGLELIGMDKEAPDIEGGDIYKDENGVPLGQFAEMARLCVWDAIPELSVEEIKELYEASAGEALSFGIVELQSDDFKDVKTNYRKVIKAYEELVAENKMTVRVWEQGNLPSVEYIQNYLNDGYGFGYGTEHYRLGPLKLVTDGALGARTAKMSVPYADAPDTTGLMLFTEEELQNMTELWYSKGWPLAVHAIGDGAMDILLRVIEKARAKYPGVKPRDGIIHCQITRPEQIDKMKELDLIAYIQPIFLNYDVQIVEARVGKERASHSYNWKEMIDKGVRVAGGSDCPVESCNIFQNMYATILRKRLNGEPAGGWRPDQNLGLHETIKLFTIDCAYASHSEDWKGSITAGKHADFVVVNEDIANLDPNLLKDVEVQETYINGDCKFKR